MRDQDRQEIAASEIRTDQLREIRTDELEAINHDRLASPPSLLDLCLLFLLAKKNKTRPDVVLVLSCHVAKSELLILHKESQKGETHVKEKHQRRKLPS